MAVTVPEPSLFDRLLDNDSASQTESMYADRLSTPRMQEILVRDLAALFSTTAISHYEDLSAYPHVQKSVLNFGLRNYLGTTMEGTVRHRIQEDIRAAIQSFEPRIYNESLEVLISDTETSQYDGTFAIIIRGEARLQNRTFPLHLEALIDPHTGSINPKTRGGL